MTDLPRSDALERVSTGAPGLDTLLGGGFLRGGAYVISGPPGAGKTVFGNQFCFHNVAGGGRSLFVSVLAESHGRMIAHLRNMSFFRPDAVGTSMTYVSGYSVLKEGGVPALQKFLQRLVRDHEATALVVDGLSSISSVAHSSLELREFLHGLSVHNALAGCTTVFITTADDKGTRDEFAMVDGIIALSAELLGLKAVRGIEILKLRGAAQLTGKHTFEITGDGLAVYPRAEALYSGQSTVDPDPDVRKKFGIPRLDEMLGGGLVAYSSTMALGSPGSGKTLLGLNFLAEGAKHGEKGMYFGFAERPQRLIQKAALLGRPIEKYVKSGLITLDAHVPVETLPDALVQELLTQIDQTGARRLFLDGLEPFAKEAIDPERTSRFLSALFNELLSRKVTVIATQQTPALFGPDLYAPTPGLEALVDNILFLRFFELGSKLHRMISILKMRESASDPSLRELLISDKGVDVGGTFSAETLLTGIARPAGMPANAIDDEDAPVPSRRLGSRQRKRR